MGISEHKQLVRRYFVEEARTKDPALVDEMCAPDYVNHSAPEGVPADREGTKQLYAMYNQALPDWDVTVEDVVAEDDRVGLRWSIQGTHEGDLMGVPPTGNTVRIGGIFVCRVDGGRIAESWELADTVGMMQQIGAAPAPEGSDHTPWTPHVDRAAVADASEAETRAVIERFDKQVYEGGDLDIVDELVAEDFAHHSSVPVPPGREGFRQFITQFREAFPDGASTTHETIVEGEKALLRYTFAGTHEGEFAGIPATGNRIEIDGISIYRVADGAVTDEWSMPDMAAMMEQLGVTGGES